MFRPKLFAPAVLLSITLVGCSPTNDNPDAGSPLDVALSPDVTVVDAGSADAASPGDAGNAACGDYVGDESWPNTLTISATEPWCVSALERESLSDFRARQRTMTFTPGDYPLPALTPATGELIVPFCVDTSDGAGPTVTAGTYEVQEFPGIESSLQISQSLSDGSAVTLSGVATLSGGNTEWTNALIDDNSRSDGFGGLSVRSDGAFAAPCSLAGTGQNSTRSLTFENGDSLSFQFNYIAGSVFTGPSGAHRVTGTVDGEAIDISNYYQILYSPSHHHFSGGGEHAVLFDAPLRGACGIRVDASNNPASAALIDCDLSDIESLAISSTTNLFAEEG